MSISISVTSNVRQEKNQSIYQLTDSPINQLDKNGE